MLKYFLTILLALLLPALAAADGPEVVEAEHTYIMGENDSRADARRLCLLEARRKLAERAGVLVQARTEVRDMQVTADEVEAFTGAVVQAEIVEERFFMSGEAFAVYVKVRGTVDPQSVERNLSDIARDPARLGALSRAANAMRGLELELDVPHDAPGTTRTLRSLEALEAEKARIAALTKRLGAAADQVVTRGMSESEVVSLLGEPRVKKVNDSRAVVYQCANYGDVWVVYRDGLVACRRTRLSYRQSYGGDCHCAGMSPEVRFD